MIDNKIIICIGKAPTPARFWNWGVILESEYYGKDGYKERGWKKTECKIYLNNKMLNYLNNYVN